MALFAAAAAGPAAASDVLCPPHLGAVEVDGNLLVIASCKLEGTVVHGNVQLFAGSSLTADRVTIHGNIEGALADFLMLFDSVVDGQVRLTDMVGNLTRISLSDIEGNLDLGRNLSRIEIQDNRVDGNVEVERNSGGVLILDNVIGGNLICRRNDPRPVGGGNVVSGNRQGQCNNLLPEDADAGGEEPDTGDGPAGDDSPDSDDGGTADEPAEDDAGGDDTVPEDSASGDEPEVVDEEPSLDPSDGSGGGIGGPGGTDLDPTVGSDPQDAEPQADPGNPGSTNGSSGGTTSDSGSIVLDPQPSGGGAAFGLLDLLLAALLLSFWRYHSQRGTHRQHVTRTVAARRARGEVTVRRGALTLFLLGATIAQAQTLAIEGTWSGVFTTQDHEFWQAEDYLCFTGCLPEGYAHLSALLDDPANDERPFQELMGEAYAFMRELMTGRLTLEGRALQEAVTPANDSALYCQPYALVREATNPLPMIIRKRGRNLVMEYEEWSLSRTIFMDGRGHPADLTPTPLGHSIGRYEDGALIVETVGLSPASFFLHLGGGGYTEQARAIERYTIAEEPRRLNLELTVEDPVMLRERYLVVKTWLYTPDVELVEDSCEDYPAQPDFDATGP